MAAVAGLPGFTGDHRKSPLALAVLLHGGLIFVLWQGLGQPPIERPEPREVLISLVTPRTEAVQPSRPTPAAPAPRQARPSLQPAPQALPLPVVEPHPLPPPLPVVRETPAQVTQPAPSAPAPMQESRTAPPVPAAPAISPPPAPAVQATPPVPPAAPAVTAPAARGPVTVSAVEYLQAPKPDYPLMAKRAGEQGKVVLRILIDEKGLPERVDIQQSAGYPRLDDAARAAGLRAVFRPHLEDGHPVPAYVLVPINFALK